MITMEDKKTSLYDEHIKLGAKIVPFGGWSMPVQYEGIIKEVTDGAVLVEKNGKLEAINLDFVIRIREYPRNKNGKKKSVVLD